MRSARRARMPSRPLPLSVHAGRSHRRGALSTSASSLPPGAFVLVPPLHDDRPPISAPMIATPNTFPRAQHPVGGVSSRRPVQPCPDPWRWLILAHLQHAAGRRGLGGGTRALECRNHRGRHDVFLDAADARNRFRCDGAIVFDQVAAVAVGGASAARRLPRIAINSPISAFRRRGSMNGFTELPRLPVERWLCRSCPWRRPASRHLRSFTRRPGGKPRCPPVVRIRLAAGGGRIRTSGSRSAR
jgi:hypothetical protein